MEEVDLSDTPLGIQPRINCSKNCIEEGPPDPRVQVELERLNTCTDLINKLEVDLDEARMLFRQTLSKSTQNIDCLSKKLGKCIDQARPYYDARIKVKQDLTETQKSAVRFERAVSQHSAAREMVQLAEEGLLTRGCIFDSTWQEMLNHATTKVNNAEKEKILSAVEHQEKSKAYHESENRVKYLQKELKRAIAKSSLNVRRSLLLLSNLVRMQELQLLPYFELKAAINQRLEEQKCHVKELECAVSDAKSNYAQALSNLETISDQIHKNRQNQLELGARGIGVGAESPGPPRETNFTETKLTTKDSDLSSQAENSNEEKTLEKINDSSASSSEVSEWQIIAAPTCPSSSQLLTVDEHTVSDSESLTSIEMLSEEAIANLMLEDELNEARHELCPPGPWEVVRPSTLPVSPSYCSSVSSGHSSPETHAYALLCDTPDPGVIDI